MPPEEAEEHFKGRPINEILRPLPDFQSIPIVEHPSEPRNLSSNQHWHPLTLFQLFFSWEVMSLIVKETNSFAFRCNSIQNPWKSLSVLELYHFFDCLLLLALYKKPIQRYLWQSPHGILAFFPISKHRFEQIMSCDNLYRWQQHLQRWHEQCLSIWLGTKSNNRAKVSSLFKDMEYKELILWKNYLRITIVFI